jgi:hypothetical protein
LESIFAPLRVPSWQLTKLKKSKTYAPGTAFPLPFAYKEQRLSILLTSVRLGLNFTFLKRLENRKNPDPGLRICNPLHT